MNGDRFFIHPDQDPGNLFALIGLEIHDIANAKVEHALFGPLSLQQPNTVNNHIVERNQPFLGF